MATEYRGKINHGGDPWLEISSEVVDSAELEGAEDGESRFIVFLNINFEGGGALIYLSPLEAQELARHLQKAANTLE